MHLVKYLSGIILVYSSQYVLTHLDQQCFTEVLLSLYISLMCIMKETAGSVIAKRVHVY